MNKFECSAHEFSEDTFGMQPQRTPISEASNFTFNPAHGQSVMMSPLCMPTSTPERKKIVWDTRLVLFDLELAC